EDPVGEAEGEDVLDRLLAQVVVDPEDLLLLEDAEQAVIERPRALEIPPERLLDDQARPAPRLARLVQSGATEVVNDRLVAVRGRREIVDAVALRAALAVEAAQFLAEPLVVARIFEGSLDVGDPLLEHLPHIGVDRPSARELVDALAHLGAERAVLQITPGIADHAEAGRQ